MNDWDKAGRIAAEALEFGRLLIVKDSKAIEICDKVDNKIVELGGKPAFPTQISLDNVAAHQCEEAILKNQVVKLDVGVHVNGAIGDNACTVDLSNKHNDLVTASRDALNNAIETIRPGVTIGEIGKAIEDAIKLKGFTPVANLSGHGLDKYSVHCKPTIPNFDTGDKTEIKEGMIFAIEPFASMGSGRVSEKGKATVFSLIASKPVRMYRDILKQIEKFENLPFTDRWLKFPEFKLKMALKQFERMEIIRSYPPLADTGLVSQAEHTIRVTKDGCEVLTKF